MNKLGLILACVVLIVICVNNFAYELSETEVKRAAQTRLDNFDQDCSIDFNGIYKVHGDDKQTLATVIELNPTGYIVMTNDTRLSPVLAFSETNDFGLLDNSNPLYNLIRLDLTSRMERFSQIPENIKSENEQLWARYINGTISKNYRTEYWPAEGSTSTGGWLEYSWHQNSPYNDFCPQAPGEGKPYAGCPSIALGMILNYHQTLNNVSFSDNDDYYHNYGGNSYWIDNDYEEYNFLSFPDLNNYLTDLSHNYENQITPTDENLAALVFGAGVAATQIYSTAGSGTFGVNQAVSAYNKFNFNDIQLKLGDDYDIEQCLIENIQQGLPAHLAVVNEAWDSGHNYVVDGYNTDGYFHMNYGWGGTSNGWYLFLADIPYNFDFVEGLIVDIIPDIPVQASSPYPADNSSEVPVNGLFMFCNFGLNTDSFDFYLGTDPNNMELLFENQDISGLIEFETDYIQMETEYFWQVKSKNNNGIRWSKIWSFTTEDDPTDAEDFAIQNIQEVQLNQNYPNPFNLMKGDRGNVTVIDYSINYESEVEISVYNLLNQKVKTLSKTHKKPGNYSVEWDGTDKDGKTVSSGVYFFKIDTDHSEKVKKMVLIR